MSRSLRHTTILVIVTLCGVAAAASGWWFARASAPVNGPIVLVSVDALRADRLHAYGYAAGRTPAIDTLATDGIVFEHAYSHVPQTLPAHVALLTGRLPFENTVRDAAGPALPAGVRTIAELLRDRGYATGGIASSWLLRRDTGIDRGFVFFDDERPAPADGSAEPALERDGSASEQVAEQWLDSIGTSRAFLFLHLAEPHAPYTPPERFADLAPYDGEVAHADEAVGRLLRYLKTHQLYDRSTIIVVADHGEGLGSHGEQTHGLLTYDEVLRVPLIIKLPGGEQAGRRVTAPVQHIDVVPTILDLAKAPGASGLSGRSLTRLFDGGTVPAAAIYAESHFGTARFGWAPILSLLEGQYRLVSSGPAHALFDLEADPSAQHDIASSKPDVVARMQERLTALVARQPPVAALAVTPADQERLEAFGYVGVPAAAADPGAPARDAAESEAVRVAFVEQYREAVGHVTAREWDAAIAAFRAVAEQAPAPASLAVWLEFARTAARGERHDVAMEAYEHVLTATPESITAHLGAGASSLRLRRSDHVVSHARAVLDAADANLIQQAEAHELLARIAVGRRALDEARAAAAAAEAADPARPVVSLIEGRIAMDQGDWARASEAFTRALDAAQRAGRPPLMDLRVFAAEALVRLDRHADAEALLVAELKVFPANPRARSVLQGLYRATGRASDAAALTQH